MKYKIEMLNITKEFPGIKANDNVSLQVKEGTIHALLGENGAGKSTLMSILFGLYQPTSGKILVNGKEVKINNPNDANELGIGMVHQHFKLVDCFTITENIILGMEPSSKLGLINYKEARNKVIEISKKYGLEVNPDALISDITVGMQQKVEILKMLYRNADILIFDEPTAVLTPQEIDELIVIMKNLTSLGKTIILITHKLKEIKNAAEICTVLRKGKLIDTVNVKDYSAQQMASLMVGRDVEFSINKPKVELGNTILEVNNLVVKSKNKINVVDNLSLNIKGGEILGIAGIDGNGQSELVYALTGLAPIYSGEILLNGDNITKSSIKQRYEKGLGHVPEDRHKHGLILDFKLRENYIIHEYMSDKFSKHNILLMDSIDKNATKLSEDFDVRSGEGNDSITRTMSGGNQQKAIIAREINRSPDLLIVVQPTRGLDVGAIEYIHTRIVEERNKGKAILLVSFEIDEILALSDRIAVMFNGNITGLLDAKETNERELGLLMSGNYSKGEGHEK